MLANIKPEVLELAKGHFSLVNSSVKKLGMFDLEEGTFAFAVKTPAREYFFVGTRLRAMQLVCKFAFLRRIDYNSILSFFSFVLFELKRSRPSRQRSVRVRVVLDHPRGRRRPGHSDIGRGRGRNVHQGTICWRRIASRVGRLELGSHRIRSRAADADRPAAAPAVAGAAADACRARGERGARRSSGRIIVREAGGRT